MKLATLLTPEQIVLDMKADGHWTAIVELVDHLISIGGLAEGLREEILDSLKQREEQVSTGIGYGVAIPHAFSENVETVSAVFGRSEAGIDFEALDNAPVHYVVLFIVPKKDYHLHLQTLAAIAKMFTNCEIREQLGKAECRAEIQRILAGRNPKSAA